MTAREILTMGESQGADCCAIYNLLTEHGHDEVAELFEGLDGRPTAEEMQKAFSLEAEIEGVAKAEAAFEVRHDL